MLYNFANGPVPAMYHNTVQYEVASKARNSWVLLEDLPAQRHQIQADTQPTRFIAADS